MSLLLLCSLLGRALLSDRSSRGFGDCCEEGIKGVAGRGNFYRREYLNAGIPGPFRDHGLYICSNMCKKEAGTLSGKVMI